MPAPHNPPKKRKRRVAEQESIKFSNFSRYIADITGSQISFFIAVFAVVSWLVTGPLFKYSDSWQLVINTGTTIVTFLMVFLIQNTQNRDSEAIQIKLDELIRSHEGAHNALLDLEELSSEQLKAIKDKYEKLAETARDELCDGKIDTSTKDV